MLDFVLYTDEYNNGLGINVTFKYNNTEGSVIMDKGMVQEEFSRQFVEYKQDVFDPVVSVGSGKVYYICEGRNAWHSTWIKRYKNGCIHASLLSAKNKCEDMQKSGSVFYIEELPAIVIRAKDKVVVATGINSDNPLKEHAMASQEIEQCLVDDFKFRFNSLSEMVKGFALHSSSWRYKIKKRNYLIIVEHWKPNLRVESLRGQLVRRKSVAMGTDKNLQWREAESAVRYEGVLQIAKNLIFVKGLSNGGGISEKNVVSLDGEVGDENWAAMNIRKYVAENKNTIKGDETSREIAIAKFIDEMCVVYTVKALARMSHDDIGQVYVDWLRSLEVFTKEEREAIILKNALKRNMLMFMIEKLNIESGRED